MDASVRDFAAQAVERIFVGDSDSLTKILTPDFEWQGPSLLGENGGRTDELLRFANTLRSSLSEFSLILDEPVVESMDAAVRWTIRGRHTGSSIGKPTGRALVFTGIHILCITREYNNSLRLSRLWQQWGQMGFLQNIELIPFIGGPGTELPGPAVERVASNNASVGNENDKEVIQRLFDQVINRKNLTLTHDLIAVDIRDHNPGPSDLPGLAGIQQVCELLRRAFPDLHGTIDGMIAEGDRVVVRWTVRGTNSCDCGGIDATGRVMIGTGIDILRFQLHGNRRQIVDRWGNSDDTGILLQLGIISLPA